MFNNNILTSLTSFKNDRNLAKHVIRSRLPEDEIPGTFPCGRSRCKTCNHILNTDTVVGPNGSVDIKKIIPMYH